jgi:hypothetical protein
MTHKPPENRYAHVEQSSLLHRFRYMSRMRALPASCIIRPQERTVGLVVVRALPRLLFGLGDSLPEEAHKATIPDYETCNLPRQVPVN